jgi:hypothetical protein
VRGKVITPAQAEAARAEPLDPQGLRPSPSASRRGPHPADRSDEISNRPSRR